MQKVINKTSLAELYGWNLSFLRKQLSTNKNLLQELTIKANYKPGQRILTPKQVNIIFKHLGNPEKI
jgi:hypothetical protein